MARHDPALTAGTTPERSGVALVGHAAAHVVRVPSTLPSVRRAPRGPRHDSGAGGLGDGELGVGRFVGASDARGSGRTRARAHGPVAGLGRPVSSGRMRLAMMRSSQFMRLGAHADATQSRMTSGCEISCTNVRGHLVVRPVGRVELAVVVDEGLARLAGQRVAERRGGQASRLVAVGDALAVEGVDRAAGVADDQQLGPTRGPTDRPIGSFPPVGGPQAGLGAETPRRRGLVDEVLHELGRVDALPPAVGREQADADVDAAVADGKIQPYPGTTLPVGVPDVEMRLDQRLVVAGRACSSPRSAMPMR